MSAPDRELLALCQEWHTVDARTADAFTEADQRQCNAMLERIAATTPKTLAGLLAQLQVLNREWLNTHSDDGLRVIVGDRLYQATADILARADKPLAQAKDGGR